MSNDIFTRLHRKMTLTYSLIFGVVSVLVVGTIIVLNAWSLLGIEKNELYDKIVHEGEEWVSSKEAPVNDKELNSGDMLAYFVTTDGKTVILDQLGVGNAGKSILSKRQEWPRLEEKTKLLVMKDNDGNKYHYLAGVAEIKDGNKSIGILYMFENFHVYDAAMKHTLGGVAIVMTVLFLLGGVGSYYIAGKNIKPIREMYNKQKRFTADASHEMRTPLAVMKLSVQGIKTDEDTYMSKFSEDALSMVNSEINRLTRLTEDLMALARSDNGTLQPLFTQVDFSKMCKTTVGQMELIALEKQISIEQNVPEGLELRGEEAGLNRLLVILLDNAVKYSPESSLINFRVNKNGHKLLLQIMDQGVGISDEDKTKVFERFYRVDKARSRSQGGLGLGLSLAKAIVDEHKGRIWMSDNKPCGTIVNVELNC